MSATGLIALTALIFLGVAAVSAILLFAWRPRGKTTLALVAAPFGCAVLPLLALTLLAATGWLFEKSDSDLYEELFGRPPSIGEDRLLFDDFGSGDDREIFLRIEPTAPERQRLLTLPGLRRSDWTADRFVARASSHGLHWWIQTGSSGYPVCDGLQLFEAPGFRGWREFRLAECLKVGSTDEGYLFIVAARSGWPIP